MGPVMSHRIGGDQSPADVEGWTMAEAGNRETISTDILIVGAGPSGLAAAIRLKQRHPDLAVTVVEKSAEIGGHILSGAVMDPKGLDALIPDWRLKGAPVGPDVTKDTYHYLTPKGDFALPHALVPPQMKTPGGVITSLGRLVQWLGEEAMALGVDIFPMTAAVDVLRTGPSPQRSTSNAAASLPVTSGAMPRVIRSPALPKALRSKPNIRGSPKARGAR